MSEHPAFSRKPSALMLSLLFLAATPVLAAIWLIPDFYPQDAPPHIYLGEVMLRLWQQDPLAERYFTTHEYPVPNSLAHAMLAALMVVLAPEDAGRVLMTLTFVGVAGGILWLRSCVRPTNLVMLVPIALLLALGRMWLLGFWGFLLGVPIFCAVAGLWWRERYSLSWRTAVFISVLLHLAWFAHLIAYLAAIGALGILLLVLRPGRRVVMRTSLAALPTLGLLGWYGRVMARQGDFQPLFLRFQEVSLSELLQYVKSIKLISLASQTAAPFVDAEFDLFVLISPAVLLSLSLALLLWRPLVRFRAARHRRDDRLAWLACAGVFIAAAVVAPDTFGSEHGGFLRERLLLFGLICLLVPLGLSQRRTIAAAVLAVIALGVQSAFVWEYGLLSQRLVGPLTRVRALVPESSRVFVVQPDAHRSAFQATPQLHAASTLGFGRRVIVWNPYEAYIYYFPVNFRPPFDEELSFEAHRARTDLLVVVGGGGQSPPAGASLLHTTPDGVQMWDVSQSR